MNNLKATCTDIGSFNQIRTLKLQNIELVAINLTAEGERFTDMSAPYDPELNSKFQDIATTHNIQLHKGVYASVVSPQLETRAEYRMLKIIGADAIGMSTVPEIIVANHLGLKAAAISVLTDECDPDNLEPVAIADIIAMAAKAEPNMITLFKELIKQI